MFSDHFHFEILNFLRSLYFEGYKKLAREVGCLVYLQLLRIVSVENRLLLFESLTVISLDMV